MGAFQELTYEVGLGAAGDAERCPTEFPEQFGTCDHDGENEQRENDSERQQSQAQFFHSSSL